MSEIFVQRFFTTKEIERIGFEQISELLISEYNKKTEVKCVATPAVDGMWFTVSANETKIKCSRPGSIKQERLDVRKEVNSYISDELRRNMEYQDKAIMKLIEEGCNLNDLTVRNIDVTIDDTTMNIESKITTRSGGQPPKYPAVFTDLPRGSGKTTMVQKILKDDPEAIVGLIHDQLRYYVENGIEHNRIIKYNSVDRLIQFLEGRRYSRLYLDEFPKGVEGLKLADALGRNHINYTVFSTFA